MPRSKMSDEKLDEIITLRTRGEKWTKIHKITGIDRRTAKNVYEKWEYNSSVEKLQEVRKEIAAEEFRTHMKSIIQLAVSLVSNLSVPSSIDDIKNSEEFFMWFLEQDLLQRYSTSEFQSDIYPKNFGQEFHVGDPRIYLDEKKLLYKSLRYHTRKDLRWNILDHDWKNAMDKCAKSVLQLQAETRQLVDNYLQNTKEPGFLERVKKAAKENDPAKNVARAIVNGIWLLIIQDKPIEKLLFETASRDITSVDVTVKLGSIPSGILLKLVGNDSQYLADNIKTQCNSAVTILRQSSVVHRLYTEVGNIRRTSDTIREMLNPLKLSPMILQTRCDLCPV